MSTIECIPGGVSAQVANLSTTAMSLLSRVAADRRHSSCAAKPTTRIRCPVDSYQHFLFNFCFSKKKTEKSVKMLFISLTAVFAVLLFADAVPTPTNNKGMFLHCSYTVFICSFRNFLLSFGGVGFKGVGVGIIIVWLWLYCCLSCSYRSAVLAALYI